MSSLTCQANQSRGVTTIVGSHIPNGDALLTRSSPGEKPYILRDGQFEVTTGGFSKDDSEPPFGVPLTYRLDVSVNDRLIQHNMMLTPTFLHGVQGWLAGQNRTVDIQADTTAHSAQVAHVNGNTAGSAPPAPPALIGHVESGFQVSGPYTLTPGGTVATGDWIYIFHQQLLTATTPAAPTGFTQVFATAVAPFSVYIWRRKRLAGDAGYAVPAVAGASSLGTLLWIRGASDTDLVLVSTPTIITGDRAVTMPPMTLQRPSLALTFSAAQLLRDSPLPAASAVNGSTWQYTQGSETNPRTTVVASYSGANAGPVPSTQITYPDTAQTAIAVMIGVQALAPTPPRIIIRGKAAALPADSQPYLMTGRFKFFTTDLELWQDVKSKGTWADVKALGDWGAVRGASAATGDAFLQLFVSIADPPTGNYYVQPIQVLNITSAGMNTWMDFSFEFTTPVDIPATAEIRITHGTNVREYGVEWWFDEFGITPPTDRPPAHSNIYWFDGDSAAPANSEDYLLLAGDWTTVSSDADMSWAGTVGNSVSLFYGPTAVYTTTVCQLDGPTFGPGSSYCDPAVFLNDPVSPQLAQWFSLIEIAPLNYAARQTLYDIINRAAATAVSQVRGWATGQLTLLTTTLAERNMTLSVLETGRILFYRNPDPTFPETSWYLAIGNVVENRLGPDHRRPERLWTVPFARVERPSGLIDLQSGNNWQSVKDANANWLEVRAKNTDWLNVLTKAGTV